MSTPTLHAGDARFDTRVIERFLAEGRVTREEYEAFLATLEDCEADADVSSVKFVATASSRGPWTDAGPEEDEG